MRTSEERVRELHRRMDKMERSAVNRRYLAICAAVCTACFAIAVTAAVWVSGLMIQPAVQAGGSVAASILADNAALGYVVIALLAFALGAAVTVFCYRLKKYMDKKK